MVAVLQTMDLEHPLDEVHLRRVILHHGNDEPRQGFCGL